MSDKPISVQLYSARQALAADRHGTLSRLAAIGYQAVEPYDILGDTAGLAADLVEFGLTVSSAHAPVLGDARDDVFAACRTLGTDVAIVPHVDPARWQTRESVAALAAELNSAAAVAAQRGLRVGYHNHAVECESVIDGRHALQLLADELDPAVVLEVDTYWAAVGGADVVALLTGLGERVGFLHVKDGPLTHDDPNVALGKGKMAVASVLNAAPYAQQVVEFDATAGDIFADLDASLRFLTTGASR